MSPALPCHWPTLSHGLLWDWKKTPKPETIKKKNQKKSQLSFWPPLAVNSTSGGGGLPWAGRGTQEQQSRELRGEAAGRVAGAAAEAKSTESQRVWSPPSKPWAESRQVQKSLQDFLFHTNSRISTWNSKAGRGSFPMSLTSALHPWGSTAWAHSSAAEAGSSAQRSNSVFLGVCSSPGPAMLIPAPAGRITLLAGMELAPTRHPFTPTGLPQGFAGGHGVPWQGGSLAHAPRDVQDVLTPSKNLLP